MRILVLGAGGVGGYFGGRLVQGGADVSFLVRPRRQAQLMEQGLVIESPLGNLRTPVATVTAANVGRQRKPFDIILLTAKAYDLDAAIDSIAPAMTDATVVVPMLNGLAHLNRLDAAFGPARVAGGSAFIVSTLDDRGVIRHMNPLARISFGARDPAQQPALDALAAAFQAAGADHTLAPDIRQAMWEKFTFLAAFAASTCLMRASIGEIMAQPGGEPFLLGVLEECAAVAAASGQPMGATALAQARGFLTERGSTNTASMLRDLQGGGAIEGEHIVGDMVRRGQDLGVPMPLMTLADIQLKAYSARLAAG